MSVEPSKFEMAVLNLTICRNARKPIKKTNYALLYPKPVHWPDQVRSQGASKYIVYVVHLSGSVSLFISNANAFLVRKYFLLQNKKA